MSGSVCDARNPVSPSERTATPPLWLLVLVSISASISMHLFVPALPNAAADLHVSASRMQLAITVYLLGLLSCAKALFGITLFACACIAVALRCSEPAPPPQGDTS